MWWGELDYLIVDLPPGTSDASLTVMQSLPMSGVVVHHEIDHLDGVLFIDRVESVDDLYQLARDEEGRPVRIPVSAARTQKRVH